MKFFITCTKNKKEVIFINEKLLKRIDQLCIERNISKRKLQNELNLSIGSISKWNKCNPSYKTLKDMSEYFDVSIDYLQGETDHRTHDDMLDHFNNTYLQPLLDSLDGLSDCDIQNVIHFVHHLKNE